MAEGPSNRRPIPARKLAVTRGIVRWLDRKGVTPDQVSIFGLGVGLLSGLLLAITPFLPSLAAWFWAGSALCVLLRGLSNMVDGMLAVEQARATPDGLFYNEVPDRLSDIALFAGAGYSLGANVTAGWLVACLALLVTYIRALGIQAGAPADFGGPFAKQQRMFSVALVSLALAAFPALRQFGPGEAGLMAWWLWILAVGTAWTAILRLRRAVAHVNGRPREN